MPDQNMHTEIWTYVGLREQQRGVFAYGWRDPDGNVYVFKKPFWRVSIGG